MERGELYGTLYFREHTIIPVSIGQIEDYNPPELWGLFPCYFVDTYMSIEK